MLTLTIHDSDAELMAALCLRAAKHGRCVGSETREILRQALAADEASTNLGSRIAALFADPDDFPE